MSELKSCPFCGGLAEVAIVRGRYTVKCAHRTNCFLYGHALPKLNVRSVLVRMWNRRAAQPEEIRKIQ